MSGTATLSTALAELERLYPLLAQQFFDEPARGWFLDNPPVIGLASKGRKRTQTGWYVPRVWEDTQEATLQGLTGDPSDVVTKRAEIVIATELLSAPQQAVVELARQMMVHYLDPHTNALYRYGSTNGAVRSGGYYPAIWKDGLATRLGCVADIDPNQPGRGWSKLVPKAPMLEFIAANLNIRAFDLARDSDGDQVRPGSRMKKWRCNCTTVRCATGLDALCDTCGYKFQWAEPAQENPYKVRTASPDDGGW